MFNDDGINILAIAQSIELIKWSYPKSWETFLANQLTMFFGCTDPTTCEVVSKMIGTTTVETSSTNKGKGKQTRSMELFGSNVSTQTGTSFSETGRRLLTPEEIKTLGNRVMIAFLNGEDPILCQRIDYRERMEWKDLWDENPLHMHRTSKKA